MGSYFPYLPRWKASFSRMRPDHLLRALAPFRDDARSDELRDIWRARNGTAVTLRAARPEDGQLIQELVHGLSLRSRYQRFFNPVHELTPGMLDRFTHNAPTEAITLLAVIPRRDREIAIAMAQYVVIRYPESCEFAAVVADDWQREGLATKLIQTLICIARAAGIERIEGDMLAENEPMLRLMLRMHFTVTQHEDGAYLLKVRKTLEAPQWKCSPLTGLALEHNQACMPA